jgi:XRE family transcriptional regulator, aerobic/anaerobic benzoate catabolism transcriptional regulator
MVSTIARQVAVAVRGAVAERLPDPAGDSAFLTALGARVRAARIECGLTRRSLAELAEVSERYLAQLEGGKANASSILLRRLARALGTRVADLLGELDREQYRIMRFIDGLPRTHLTVVLDQLVAQFGAEQSVRRKRIALVGLRGAGKSTLGAALAKEMRRAFIELDGEVEAEAGMPLSEIFLLYGQPGYRRLERLCLERVIRSQRDVVVSVGGGAVADADTLQMLLTNCFTVWIKASPAEHMARVLAQGDTRPMVGRAQAMRDLKSILASREAQYSRADRVVDTTGRSIERSLAALRRSCAAPCPAKS